MFNIGDLVTVKHGGEKGVITKKRRDWRGHHLYSVQFSSILEMHSICETILAAFNGVTSVNGVTGPVSVAVAPVMQKFYPGDLVDDTFGLRGGMIMGEFMGDRPNDPMYLIRCPNAGCFYRYASELTYAYHKGKVSSESLETVSKVPKCECGAVKAQSPHASWCDIK